MIYRILTLVVILALLGGTFFFGNPGGDREQPVVAHRSSADAGYAARDAEIIETGPDGQPRYRLEAERITQPGRDSTVSLENVIMHYRTELGTEWRMRADHGELPEDARNIALAGSVRVNGPIETPEPRDGQLELATERVNIDTLEQIVTTGDPVTVLWSGERLQSHGLWANLKDQRLQLLSSVHGRVTPH